MFVKLFTGLPGAGKTAQLVAELVRLQRDEPHRPLFAMGINGLKEGIATPLTYEMLQTWWELPPGSIIAIDECQEDQPDRLMPKDAGNPSPWVQKIAKVRHFGMTFLLTTQHPNNMSAYVRRLVDQHIHTVDKFGTGVITRVTWNRCMDDPEKPRNWKSGVEEIATRPKEVFDLYKSSQLHTRKRRIPRKVYMFGVLALTAVAAIVAVPILIKRAQDNNQASIAAPLGGAASASAPVRESPRVAEDDATAADAKLRREDYPRWMTPRVEGQPWTAPAFDHLEVQAQPRVFCVAGESGSCHCRTEQGTKYDMELNLCRATVKEGGAYNPFMPNPDLVRSKDASQRSAPEAALPPVPTAGGRSAPVTDGGWNRGIGTSYVEPERTKVSAIGS